MKHVFVTPALDGPRTGGTLYNRELVLALRACGVSCAACPLGAASQIATMRDATHVWLDALHLQAAPALRASLPHALTLGALLHSLPSLLADGLHAGSRLAPDEEAALTACDAALAPSTTLQAYLTRAIPQLPVFRVEPGLRLPAELAADGTARHDGGEGIARALLIGNVAAGMGVLRLLQALPASLHSGDTLELRIAGRLDAEPAFAAACLALVARTSSLVGRVRWLGSLPHAEVLQQLQQSALLLSASRFESYGMALSEARALGTPILACAGGHVAAHVDPAAGGELVESVDALAARCTALLRDPATLARRASLARAGRRMRTWSMAATEFLRATSALGPHRAR